MLHRGVEHCNHCGNDVESEAHGCYTDNYGFVCTSCMETMHMCPCTMCGRRFPYYEMVEWDGDLFCRHDYEEEQSILKEAEAKKSQKPNPALGGTPFPA